MRPFIPAHARQRLRERVPRASLCRVLRRLACVAHRADGRSYAVVVSRLRRQVGRAWGGASNGDLVVAVLRNRRVSTVMLRRSSQPFTPRALGVDFCLGERDL